MTNLQDTIDSTDDLVQTFRDMDLEESIWDYPDKPYDFPKEFTHWIREQRAWRESAALIDQSYHMANMAVTGSHEDAVDLFESLAVNSFEDWRTGEAPKAKQFIACNPDGYLIGDCILFWLEEGRYLMVGEEPTHNWVQYHTETGDYDLESEFIYNPIGPSDPTYFRFEVMGPDAMDLMDDVVDGGLPEIHFFQMTEFSINGVDVYAVGHQMTSEKGIEFFGDYDHHDEIHELLHEEGEKYDLHQVGNKAYVTTGIELGWIPLAVPAVYDHPDMQDYRDWLSEESLEANLSIGGSFVADDITDYYATLGGMGYSHIPKFDHDFVGREAIEGTLEEPDQKRVTFIFDDEDVMRIQNSIFRDGDNYRFMQIPDVAFQACLSRHDEVLIDGEHVGISKHPAFSYNEHEAAALGWIDAEHAEPGTRVSVLWGDPDTAKTQVEPHVVTDIQATVMPAPYMKTDREDM